MKKDYNIKCVYERKEARLEYVKRQIRNLEQFYKQDGKLSDFDYKFYIDLQIELKELLKWQST